MTDVRLLGHLAGRFAPSEEDIATESLAFVLHHSFPLRAAFGECLTSIIPGLQAPAAYRTQVSQALVAPADPPGDPPASGTGRPRPDMVGFDSAGNEAVLVESKFWAGLTDHQPVNYLKRLAGRYGQASAVVVIAPGRRLDSLWRDLRDACAREGTFTFDARDGSHAPDWHVVEVAPRLSLALTTWAYVLRALQSTAELEGDHALSSDLLQLGSLVERQDANAFIPVRSEELGPDVPRRLFRWTRLVDMLVTRLAQEPLLRRGTVGQAFGFYGRYIDLQGKVWVGLWLQRWEEYGGSPLWMQVRGDELALSGLEDALRAAHVGLFREAGQLLVPLVIPPGLDEPEVLDHLVSQVVSVARHLAQ